jgi:hypothetical protein
VLAVLRGVASGIDVRDRGDRPEERTAAAASPADALVIIGVTGDLASKMTSRSLYRLERRRLLH